MTVAVALDLGTTAIKAGRLAADGTLSGVVTRPAPDITVNSGAYESDALAYALTAETVLAECLGRSGMSLPLGLCSQRSSFLLWDRASGQPVTPLISWQDDRGAASCAELRAQATRIRAISGLPLTPYYLATKLRVLLREHPEWHDKLASGEWLPGTLDTFLIWRWSGGKQHVTDVSMAARTLLLDVHTQQWSAEACALFGIPMQALPQLRASAGMGLRLDNGLLLQASVADQSAALFASIAPGRAEAQVNLGTGGFVVCYLPPGRRAPAGYLQTLVWQDAAQRVYQAAEGTLNSIAAALKPYPVEDCRPEEMASDDIFCLAEPSGIGAPYFRGDLGLTFSAPVDHLPPRRIALLLQEAIVFRVARILGDFAREYGVTRAWLSGGLSALPCLQQGIANCAPFSVHRLPQTDASLLGAARLAAGMEAGMSTPADGLVTPSVTPALAAKYRRWQVWLDGRLRHYPD